MVTSSKTSCRILASDHLAIASVEGVHSLDWVLSYVLLKRVSSSIDHPTQASILVTACCYDARVRTTAAADRILSIFGVPLRWCQHRATASSTCLSRGSTKMAWHLKTTKYAILNTGSPRRSIRLRHFFWDHGH